MTAIRRYDPLGRLVRTELPDGTLTRVTFDAWSETTWDESDTVAESAWLPRAQAGDAAAQRSATLALVHAGTPVTVALVKGNVPQDEKWDPDHAPEILGRYLSMTREAAARGATLVLWPESSTPFNFEEHAAGGGAVRDLAATTNSWLLFGSDQVERGGTPRYYKCVQLGGL